MTTRRSFTLATFNANSIRSRLPVVLEWLERQKPDCLCLQETKATDEDFPAEPFRQAGWHVVFKGEKKYNGVAIVSRTEPEDVAFGLDDGGPKDESRLIRAVVSGIAVLNTYVPQGQDVDSPRFAYKLEWFRRLGAFLQRHYRPDRPLIWCGDLNVAPEGQDVHDPKRLLGHVCFHPEVTKAFLAIQAWGLVDVFRKHHPEPGQYTFFDYRTPDAVGRGLGWRVDHVLATKPLAERSEDAFIDTEPRRREKASDHTFLVARFRS